MAAQEIGEVHYSAFYSEVGRKGKTSEFGEQATKGDGLPHVI